MSTRPSPDGERTELVGQDLREMESPEVACAVDALLDFMESYPETWGRKPKGSIVPLPKRHYDSVWLKEYLSSFLSVPYFVESPEIRAWLLKAGIFVPSKGDSQRAVSFSHDALASYSKAKLTEDLDNLRKSTQDEVLERIRTERPELLAGMEQMMQREDAQLQKTAHLRDLVFQRALQWMKKNKKWMDETPKLLSLLPQVLSSTCACFVEIEYEQLLEELKMRQYVEIAPLDPEETDEQYADEVVWHMDHLDLKPRRFTTSSNFSCGRLLILLLSIAMMVSTLLQLGGNVFDMFNPQRPR